MTTNWLVGIDASRSYKTPMTGTERYSRRLIEHLLQIDPGRMRYRLYFNQPPPEDAVLPNADIRAIPARRLWTHSRLSRELRNNQVDLLFVPSHVIPLIHPERSVVTIHDLGYLYEPECHTRASRAHLQMTTRWNARAASHLIAISESTRSDLIERYKVPPEKITVVMHGIDRHFQILPGEEIERYRRAARLPEQFVLYLGTVQPRKNLVRLISAFEHLASEEPDVHLVIAGALGRLSESISQRVETSPFRERIRFLGYVPDPQLPLLYSAATSFALPSLYEGFGLPVLEAMAVGVPVVMSDRGALPELSGADASVVDPTDCHAIADRLKSALKRRFDEHLVQTRTKHAQQFRWEHTAQDTREVLRMVLAQ